MIIIENLKKYYGSVRGCESVSFTVKPKEIFGFIGPNGAGKSTTINCIMGLIKPTSGQVTLLGQDAFTLGHTVRDSVGFMPAENSLPNYLTAEKYLQFICASRNMPEAKVQILADRLELPLNRKIKTLSSGNKKKVAIIAAICTNAKVIVLDEPTSGLDPLMQNTFFDILKEQAQMGSAILFSTHILADIKKVCNKIGIIKNGTLVSVEEAQSFNEKQIKDVSFELDYGKINAKDIKLAGVKNFKMTGKLVSFDYNGNMKELITFLNTYPITNLDIKDVDIETIFMRYYD